MRDVTGKASQGGGGRASRRGGQIPALVEHPGVVARSRPWSSIPAWWSAPGPARSSRRGGRLPALVDPPARPGAGASPLWHLTNINQIRAPAREIPNSVNRILGDFLGLRFAIFYDRVFGVCRDWRPLKKTPIVATFATSATRRAWRLILKDFFIAWCRNGAATRRDTLRQPYRAAPLSASSSPLRSPKIMATALRGWP